MSFSIPTLKAFTIPITQAAALLSAPTINLIGNCSACPNFFSGTITAAVGATVRFKIGAYSDSLTVTCSDYTYSTVGNIAYLDNSVATDHFSCLSRYGVGYNVKAIACSGASSSATASYAGTSVACPTTVTAPTIALVSVDTINNTTTFNVTSYSCGTTYITYQQGIFCGQGARTPFTYDYDFLFIGSGVSSNYTVPNQGCTSSNFGVAAFTRFDYTGGSCTAVDSSTTFANNL